MPTTDHTAQIAALREHNSIQTSLAADLLEIHDATGISLDDWENAREFIRAALDYIEFDGDSTLQENGA